MGSVEEDGSNFTLRVLFQMGSRTVKATKQVVGWPDSSMLASANPLCRSSSADP